MTNISAGGIGGISAEKKEEEKYKYIGEASRQEEKTGGTRGRQGKAM